MINVGEREPRLAQAVGDGLRRESGPVLDAPEALLFRRCDENALAHNRCRGIAVEGVEAQDDHRDNLVTSRRSNSGSYARRASADRSFCLWAPTCGLIGGQCRWGFGVTYTTAPA